MKISVLGGGAFGTAMAQTLAQRYPITLWVRRADQAAELQSSGRNEAYVPGVDLAANISVTSDLSVATQADTVLLAIPTQQLRPFLQSHSTLFRAQSLIACCKGVDLETGHGPVKTIDALLSNATSAMLTGPSFARDIAAGKPTALTLACADEAKGTDLQHALTTPNLRLYRTTDTVGAELGGALKNVIAIAAGAVMGAGLGDSARAAVITRGFAEMLRFAEGQGARSETLTGLSGFGDLVLTCTSEQSRNFRYGQSLGAGAPFDSHITVEGAATARAVAKLSDDLPITSAVIDVMGGRRDIFTVMQSLLDRPLKEE